MVIFDCLCRGCFFTRSFWPGIFALICAVMIVGGNGYAEDGEISVDIPSQEAGKALDELSRQTGLSFVHSIRDIDTIKTKAVSGKHPPTKALEIMLAGTGLAFEQTSDTTISIQKAPSTLTLQSKPDFPEAQGGKQDDRRRIHSRAGKHPPVAEEPKSGKPDQPAEALGTEKKHDEREIFTLDEITVTATKREESILEVPLTMSAFDHRRIQLLGIISMDDLNMLVPGLQIGEESDLKGYGWVIRGIGSRLWAENHSDLAVATYVDDVYQYAPMGMAPSMFDIERVEVARGPQGTVHGRNSIAGSVSFFNKRPTFEWDFDLLAEWTDQVTERYGVAFGGPIVDRLSFRVTAHILTGDGAQENIGPGQDLDAPDDTYYATALRFKTNRLDINLRYHKIDNEGTPRSQINLGVMDKDQIDNVWDNEAAAANYNHWYKWNYDVLGEPFPATADCDTTNLQYITQAEDSPEGWVEGSTRYYYFNTCEDLKNVVNTNGESLSKTLQESTSLTVDFDIFKSLSMRMIYGTSRLFHSNSREQDANSRTGGWEGDLWFEDPNTGEIVTDRSVLSKDAGVWYWEQWYSNPYTLSQSSGEITLFSDFDGAFNFIAGVFYYQNNTRYEHDTYSPSIWWRHRQAETDWPEMNAEWQPHTWGAWWNPVFGSELADAGPDGQYPDTQAGCEEFLWDINIANNYDFLPGLYTCVYNEPDHQNTFNFLTEAQQETKGAFVHAGWQFNDQLSIAGGARLAQDYKKKVREQYWAQGMWEGRFAHRWQEPQAARTDPLTWDKIIWDVSVEYSFAENMMAYGRVATGYRSGSFQSWIYEDIPSSPIVDSETLINYEIGVKGTTQDQRIWFTAGAFYSPYDGFQIDLVQEYPKNVPIPVTSGSPLLDYVANIDGTKIWGAEIEATVAPAERWRFGGYYIYMDSELGAHSSVTRGDPNTEWATWWVQWIPSFNCDPWLEGEAEGTYCGAAEDVLLQGDLDTSIALGDPCEATKLCWGQTEYVLPTDKTGNQLAMQPNHKWSLTASYTMPVPDVGRWNLGSVQFLTTYSYTGLLHPYIANLSSQEMPGFGQLSVRASWWSESGRWSATLWASNVLDTIGITSYAPATVAEGGGASTGQLTNPRRIGFVIRYQL